MTITCRVKVIKFSPSLVHLVGALSQKIPCTKYEQTALVHLISALNLILISALHQK